MESHQPRSRLLIELREVPGFLLQFVKKPLETVKSIPDWSWRTSVIVMSGITVTAGVLQGILARSFLDFIIGFLLFPLIGLVTSSLIALSLYYFFVLFYSTYLDLRRVYVLTVLALSPFLALQIFSSLLPPISLLGFACTCFLLVVGLCEQFRLERKPVIRLVSAIFALFLVIWIVAQLRSNISRDESIRSMIPNDLDTLEKELKDK